MTLSMRLRQQTITRNFEAYHKSIAAELRAAQNRMRDLIGARHWGEEGRHKEVLLRKVLTAYASENVRIGTGFVSFTDELIPLDQPTSTQIDILLTDKNKPVLFREGELVIVTPDVVKAIIEVKTRIRGRQSLLSIMRKLADQGEQVKRHQRTHYYHSPFGARRRHQCKVGLFVYDDCGAIGHEEILDALIQSASGNEERVIDYISIGSSKFLHFWPRASRINNPAEDSVWHAYDLHELSQAYFINNMILDSAPNTSHSVQTAWFPIEGGKETRRRCCGTLNGIIREF